MEIVHVVLGKANPERMNGVNKVVNELASQQVKAGFNVSVWGMAADLEHNYPNRNYTTKLFLKAKFPFSFSSEIKEAILKMDFDTVFHLHGGFIPQLFVFSRFLYDNNIPYVFTPHGAYNTVATNKNKVVKTIYRHFFEAKMLRKASTIHVLGESEVYGLKKWHIETPVKVIPYGYATNVRTEVILDSHKPFVVGFCGRIDIITKGLDALLEGFKRFHKDKPESELWIIGSGSELGKLRAMINTLGITDQVVLHGAKYGFDKEMLLEQCNVFAHPSRNEGLAASVLEAASLGIPCLVTRATNTGKAIEKYDAGFVIEETTGHLVHKGLLKIHHAIVNEDKSSFLRSNAKKMIREEFNWSFLMESYRSLYGKALQCIKER
jgi:glycosyltransferase involved in cell wall biosynthesis